MSVIVRASRPRDLEALYEMAKLAGPGFTNLPADRAVLAAKLAASEAAFGKSADEPGDDGHCKHAKPYTRVRGKVGEDEPAHAADFA